MPSLPYPHEPFSCLSTLLYMWVPEVHYEPPFSGPTIHWDNEITPSKQFDQSLKKWCGSSSVVLVVCCWRSPRACVTAAHTNHTMQVVENGFAPSSDVWGSFWAAGPLFVVKSGLHSITYQMESTRLSGNSQSYWVVSHCDRFTQKYALKDEQHTDSFFNQEEFQKDV